MPWDKEAMKDVARCDKPRLAVSRLLPGDFRMGKPTLTISFRLFSDSRKEVDRVSPD